MDELFFDTALDRIVTRFIKELGSRMIARLTIVDTFLSIQAGILDADELAGLVAETGVVRLNTEALVNDAYRLYEESVIEGAQTGLDDVQKLQGPDTEWEWSVESANPCDDCIARDGQVETYSGWESRGLPRTGATICGMKCQCVLSET